MLAGHWLSMKSSASIIRNTLFCSKWWEKWGVIYSMTMQTQVIKLGNFDHGPLHMEFHWGKYNCNPCPPLKIPDEMDGYLYMHTCRF